MEQPASTPTVPVDEQGSLAVDLNCKKCAYNLRGLREDGRCPECGTPVGLSTRGDLLRFADPAWVETVARGLTIILWMVLVSVLVGLLAGILGAAIHPALTYLVGLCAGAVGLYGVWLMTTPDPSGVGEDPNITARKLVRFCVAVGLLSTVFQMLAELRPGGLLYVVIMVLYVLAMAVSLVGEFAKFVFYERLAARIPEESLVVRARFLKWAFTITFAISFLGGMLFGFIRGASGSGPAPRALGGLMCLAVPVLLAWVVFGVMTLFLIIRLRRAIKEQAKNARLLWASELTAPPNA